MIKSSLSNQIKSNIYLDATALIVEFKNIYAIRTIENSKNSLKYLRKTNWLMLDCKSPLKTRVAIVTFELNYKRQYTNEQ